MSTEEQRHSAIHSQTDEPSCTDVPFGWVLLGSVLLVACSLLVLPRSYGEADDPAMVDFLQSGFHVSFMSLILSRLMSCLYQWQPEWPWYGWYQYAALTLCLALSTRLILTSPISGTALARSLQWLILGVFVVTFFGFTTRMTFTYTGILLGGLSILYLCRYLRDEGTRLPWLKILGAGVLLALCWLTRWEALKSMVFFVPLLLPVLWVQIRAIKLSSQTQNQTEAQIPMRWDLLARRWLVSGLVFVLPLMLAISAEKLLLPQTPLAMTPEEQRFDTFMYYHQDNIGFGISNLAQNPGFLKQLNWSEADYQMYQHWLYVHEDKFSTEAVQKYAELTKPMIKQVMLSQLSPEHWLGAIWRTMNDSWFKQRQFGFLPLAMALLAGFLPIATSRRWTWGYLVIIFVGSLLMTTFLRFPLRVAGPVFYLGALGMLQLLSLGAPCYRISPQFDAASHAPLLHPAEHQGEQSLGIRLWAGRWLLGVGLATLLLVPVGETIYQTWQIQGKQQRFNDNISYLKYVTQGGYLLRESGLISLKWFDPLNSQHAIFSEVSAGWAIFSKPYYERLQQLGLQRASQVLPWMVDQPKALVLAGDKQLPVIRQFMLETYGLKVELLPAGKLPIPPSHKLYRIVSLPPNSKGSISHEFSSSTTDPSY